MRRIARPWAAIASSPGAVDVPPHERHPVVDEHQLVQRRVGHPQLDAVALHGVEEPHPVLAQQVVLGTEQPHRDPLVGQPPQPGTLPRSAWMRRIGTIQTSSSRATASIRATTAWIVASSRETSAMEPTADWRRWLNIADSTNARACSRSRSTASSGGNRSGSGRCGAWVPVRQSLLGYPHDTHLGEREDVRRLS